WFNNALLLLRNLDTLLENSRSSSYGRLMSKLGADGSVTILTGENPWPKLSANIISVPFPIPDFGNRRNCWQNGLSRQAIQIEDCVLDALSERFRLAPHQIEEAIASAFNRARWRQVAQTGVESSKKRNGRPFVADLFHTAREQAGHDLAALTQKIEPKYTWNDIVLPEDTLNQLHEICQRVIHRHRVLGEWGFDRKLSLGKGVNALFAGPSGTGKTMAAEVIANELGLDLYKIDLSGVVSKYIGETEKNLDRIFTAAGNANAILLFDEADALFGKRSEVRDSHDRYSNIETCYLLQKMEQFDGIAILATNQRQNLDAAFTRRLAFTIHFPFPDEANRQQIWEGIWPVQAPVADDVDRESLASQFKLSGGNIKNIALAASFLAAEDGGPITMTHLLRATRREYQKMGKVLSEVELKSTDNKAVPKARNAA
ncbi:MAG: ATP-binding protein, partial [Gammaproteobacteria bacterium]